MAAPAAGAGLFAADTVGAVLGTRETPGLAELLGAGLADWLGLDDGVGPVVGEDGAVCDGAAVDAWLREAGLLEPVPGCEPCLAAEEPWKNWTIEGELEPPRLYTAASSGLPTSSSMTVMLAMARTNTTRAAPARLRQRGRPPLVLDFSQATTSCHEVPRPPALVSEPDRQPPCPVTVVSWLPSPRPP